MISEYIKNKLNVLLNEKSLSQKMLAKTIGVHQAQISMFASGSRSITMEFAEKFFRAYPAYFFKDQSALFVKYSDCGSFNSFSCVNTNGVPYFKDQKASENDIIMIPGFEDCDRWEVVFNRDLMPMPPLSPPMFYILIFPYDGGSKVTLNIVFDGSPLVYFNCR